jgi:uncharacterized protein YutE (UPF0331/DUF86 family)
VTIRRASLEARLRRLADIVRRLRRYREAPRERFLADEDLQWLVERGLHLACEIVLDVGNHILAGAIGRPAEGYEQILTRLSAEGVLSKALLDEVGGLGSFRNVLVHAYMDIDAGRVHDALLRAPERFERFSAEILAWLDRRG